MVSALALVVTACTNLGRDIPVCDYEFTDTPGAIILEAQAVPEARLGPCVNELEPGWEVHHLEPESGLAAFTIDSDRLGEKFLVVTLKETCDPGSAVARRHDDPRIERFVDATAEIDPVNVTIVAVSPSSVDYAASIGVDLSDFTLRGRPMRLTLDDRVGDSGARAAEALAAGHIVFIASDRDRREGTMEVRLPTGEVRPGLDLADAIDEAEDVVLDGSYSATWYHKFDGGCITYAFDATGTGVETVTDEVEAALGFADLERLRRSARQAGFDIGVP
jgi:hypothetical protein